MRARYDDKEYEEYRRIIRKALTQRVSTVYNMFRLT